MAFATRIDYFDQAANAVIELVASAANKAYAVNLTGPSERGDVIARDLGGLREAPTCDFVVKKAGDLDIELGAISTITTSTYCLLGLSIATKAATAPTVQMSGESLQESATVSSTVTVPPIALSALHKAQILASAFTLRGDGCKLPECNLEVKANLTRATKDGETRAHDVSGASITVSGKVVQTGATAPTIAAAEGWKLTQPATSTDPAEGYTEWSFESIKDLESDEPEAE